MKIDTALIEGYDEMSADEKVEALLKLELGSDAENTIAKLKETISNLSSENKKRKDHERELDEALKSKMTDDERTKAEADAEKESMKAKLLEYERKDAIREAIDYYQDLGMTREMATETATAEYDGNRETVKANMLKFKDEFEKSVRADVTKSTPRPEGAGGSPSMTKEQIMSIKDSRERQQAIADNPELFGLE